MPRDLAVVTGLLAGLGARYTPHAGPGQSVSQAGFTPMQLNAMGRVVRHAWFYFLLRE